MLLFLLITNLFSTKACDCVRVNNLNEEQKISFEESDLVFIAKVVSVGESIKYESQGWANNIIFEVEVIENFKGTEVGKVLKGRSLTSCTRHPDTGIWVIYANIDDEGYVEFSHCGISRAFDRPEEIHFKKYVPYPPTKEKSENWQLNDYLDLAIEIATIKLKAANELREEVLWLRSLK